MASKPAGPIAKAWYLWKSLRLPWRKRFLVGQDPQGNTYYELRQPRGDAPSTAPHRRLVHYPRSTPYSEVRVPPAWHQWLRHQRESPPSMQEQVAELRRQARIKVLAAEADARWEAKPSLLDMPMPQKNMPQKNEVEPRETPARMGHGREQEQEHQQRQQQDPRVGAKAAQADRGGGKEHDSPAKRTSPEPATSPGHDPWAQAQRGTPGEDWQPETWTPMPTKKR
ncbi:putative DEHA2G08052p-like protein [Rosellinia necatrix]|uniref:Putative DEHA2G08052p-like protein n=1 Tax=Rosellinia necatrix TaxID=77044 RepID=A0A1W2TMX9_ROSNE|nr:putative DEHA2G08052p-like protein [Rosellinia necatrix]